MIVAYYVMGSLVSNEKLKLILRGALSFCVALSNFGSAENQVTLRRRPKGSVARKDRMRFRQFGSIEGYSVQFYHLH